MPVQYPATYDVTPIATVGPPRTVLPPGSKSLTNRALVCAALAKGRSTLCNVLVADDTEAMLESLRRLGIGIAIDDDLTATVEGGTLVGGDVSLDVRQSGTTSRFLIPMVALGTGSYIVDGHQQMRARPFDDLVGSLQTLGARIEGTTMPLRVDGTGLSGGTVHVPGTVSSQFLSGLLLSAPNAQSPVEIIVDGELVSKPYVDLTLDVMRAFGARTHRDGYIRFGIDNSGYEPTCYDIEPDASAASYFFAGAAITGQAVTVEGLGENALQGDIRFVDALEEMGANVERHSTSTTVSRTGPLRGIDIDMADFSDTAQTLAAVAVFATSPTRVRGIGFIRRKETDRIGAVVAELRRLGIEAYEDADGFTVMPGPTVPATVQTYDDHRMAMSFALIGLLRDGVSIDNPSCVAKTFPRFFEQFEACFF